jgi:hypothetical protein
VPIDHALRERGAKTPEERARQLGIVDDGTVVVAIRKLRSCL